MSRLISSSGFSLFQMSVRLLVAFLLTFGMFGSECLDAGEPSGGEPLKRIWKANLNVHDATNVVIGQLDRKPVYCVVGTEFKGDRQAAAVEFLNAEGKQIRLDSYQQGDQKFQNGAYLHWIDGIEPAVIYSWVSDDRNQPGGARVVRVRDGKLAGSLKNVTHFGNNNSIIGDLNGDGKVEVIYADQKNLTSYQLPHFKQRWTSNVGMNFCWSLPALCDLDDDGFQEIVYGSEYDNTNGKSSLVALDRRGKILWQKNGFAEDLGSTPVFIADVDGDGTDEIIKVGLDLEHRLKQQWSHVYIFNKRGELKKKIELGCTGLAIGNMDDDPHLEGVGLSNTRDGGNNGRREIRCIDLATGKLEWSIPISRAYLDCNSPIMADFDGDGRLEAVVGTGNPAGYARLPNSVPWGDLYVVSGDGRIEQHLQLEGWPVNMAFCDSNRDGRAELTVVINGKPGYLAVYETHAKTKRIDWTTPFGNAKRSGAMPANAKSVNGANRGQIKK